MPITLIERKVVGQFIIYERRPKPTGSTKYVVGKEGETEMKDFGKFSSAVRWAKSQSPRPVPTVVIDMDDKSGISTMPVNYTILDGPHVTHHSATVDPFKVEAILGTIPTQ